MRRIVVPSKQAAVNAFVMGKSIAEIAQDTASHKLRIEQVLREALIGLAALVKSLDKPDTMPIVGPYGVVREIDRGEFAEMVAKKEQTV